MLDRTTLRSPNRLGLFGMASEASVDRIYAAVPRAVARDCAALYQRLGLHAARQSRSSLAHGQGCVVAVPELALSLRCSVRSVQRWLALLVSAGLLEVFARADRTGRALASEYVFRYPRPGATTNVPHGAPGDSYSADRPAACGVAQPGDGDARVGTPKDVERPSITSYETFRAWAVANGHARPIATAPATSPTSAEAVPVVPVAPPVGAVPVPVAAPAAAGSCRSPSAAAPPETLTAPPGSGSPPGASRPASSPARGPAPAPPRPPASLRSLLPVVPVVPVGSAPFPVGRPVAPTD